MINTDKLHNIKNIIESMNKNYHIEILKLLMEEKSIIMSENNNGTFINLSNLDIEIINKLENFIEYVKKQQNQLSLVENKKIDIKEEFFNINSSKQSKQNIENNNISSSSNELYAK